MKRCILDKSLLKSIGVYILKIGGGIHPCKFGWSEYCQSVHLRNKYLWDGFSDRSIFFPIDRKSEHLIAMIGKSVIGSCSYEGTRLHQLIVAPEWENRGVGTTLVRNALIQCRKNTHSDVISVCPDISTNLFFYKFGFLKSDDINNVYGRKSLMLYRTF